MSPVDDLTLLITLIAGCDFFFYEDLSSFYGIPDYGSCTMWGKGPNDPALPSVWYEEGYTTFGFRGADCQTLMASRGSWRMRLRVPSS